MCITFTSPQLTDLGIELCPPPQGRLFPSGPDGVHRHSRGAESAQPPRVLSAKNSCGVGPEAAAHQPVIASLP